jgi:hypothetical protein
MKEGGLNRQKIIIQVNSIKLTFEAIDLYASHQLEAS